jgi:hypothetical protein
MHQYQGLPAPRLSGPFIGMQALYAAGHGISPAGGQSLSLHRAAGCTPGAPMRYPVPQSMIFSREYIGYLARRTVKHLIDAKLVTTSNLKVVEARVTEGLIEELSLEDRINEEVRVILDAYSEEMRKSGAQYAEMFKKVKTELARKYKAVL